MVKSTINLFVAVCRAHQKKSGCILAINTVISYISAQQLLFYSADARPSPSGQDLSETSNGINGFNKTEDSGLSTSGSEAIDPLGKKTFKKTELI